MGIWLLLRYGFPDGPQLSDIGDFLAGIFAPLAFVWLVIGYFQQSAELSLNTRSLALQVSEMRESVRQQSEQAAALGRSEAHSRRDVLMRIVEFYSNLLASYACDLWRLAADVEEARLIACWDRYSKGDKDIFFFHLTEALRRADRPAASAGNQREMHRLGEEYLRIYDAFVAELSALDAAAVLRDIYSSGDMLELRGLIAGLRPGRG